MSIVIEISDLTYDPYDLLLKVASIRSVNSELPTPPKDMEKVVYTPPMFVVYALVTIMKPLANGSLPAKLALKWLLNQPISTVVPGSRTLEEVE